MSSDTKIIIGLMSLGFAMLHLLLLGYVMLGLEGEEQGLILYLELPAMILWKAPMGSWPAYYAAYLWIAGTLTYALVFGVPVGFLVDGIRRLFKWLNDEKWGA